MKTKALTSRTTTKISELKQQADDKRIELKMNEKEMKRNMKYLKNRVIQFKYWIIK